MSSTRVLFRVLVSSFVAAAAVGAAPTSAQSDAPGRRVSASPWGVSSSASAVRDHAEWFPKMAAAGVSTVRLFPDWRSFEPRKGT